MLGIMSDEMPPDICMIKLLTETPASRQEVKRSDIEGVGFWASELWR